MALLAPPAEAPEPAVVALPACAVLVPPVPHAPRASTRAGAASQRPPFAREARHRCQAGNPAAVHDPPRWASSGCSRAIRGGHHGEAGRAEAVAWLGSRNDRGTAGDPDRVRPHCSVESDRETRLRGRLDSLRGGGLHGLRRQIQKRSRASNNQATGSPTRSGSGVTVVTSGRTGDRAAWIGAGSGRGGSPDVWGKPGTCRCRRTVVGQRVACSGPAGWNLAVTFRRSPAEDAGRAPVGVRPNASHRRLSRRRPARPTAAHCRRSESLTGTSSEVVMKRVGIVVLLVALATGGFFLRQRRGKQEA